MAIFIFMFMMIGLGLVKSFGLGWIRVNVWVGKGLMLGFILLLG